MKYYTIVSDFYIYKLIIQYLDPTEWEYVPYEYWFKTDKGVILYKPKNRLNVDFFPDSILSNVSNNFLSGTYFTDRIKLNSICPKKNCPESYIVDNGIIEKENNIKQGIWFLKENNSAYGNGITICESIEDIKLNIDPKKKYILQKHINRPLLLKKKKNHLRIYFLIYFDINTKKYYFYIYKDGLIIISKYIWSKKTDKKVQLTRSRNDKNNTCINFKEYEYYNKLYNNIKICIKNLIENFILHLSEFKGIEKTTYELFGIDILFNKDNIPFILEINKGPLIGIENKKMIKDLTNIVFNSKKTKHDFTLLRDY